MAPKLTDADLLGEVLALDMLSDDEQRAFENMQEQLLSGDRAFLSRKQRLWLESRLGSDDYVPEAENLFSKLAPARQQTERARAAAVVLPWEREGYTPPKPIKR